MKAAITFLFILFSILGSSSFAQNQEALLLKKYQEALINASKTAANEAFTNDSIAKINNNKAKTAGEVLAKQSKLFLQNKKGGNQQGTTRTIGQTTGMMLSNALKNKAKDKATDINANAEESN